MMKVLPMIYVPIHWNSSPFLIMASLHRLVLFTGDLLHFAVLDNNDFFIKIFGGEIFAFFQPERYDFHTYKKMAMFQKILEKKKLKSPYFYNRCSQNII
jgi:hypothetical protein